MHRSPLTLAAALASMLVCGAAAAQLRPPLTPPAQPAASTDAPVAQATPVPATPGAATAASPAAAEASPAVRQVPSPQAPPAPAAAARAGADDLDQPGAVTRALMAAQADGRRAGPGVPLQGPVATAAWKRYIQSFEQPLPQWFGTRIEGKSGGSGGGG